MRERGLGYGAGGDLVGEEGGGGGGGPGLVQVGEFGGGLRGGAGEVGVDEVDGVFCWVGVEGHLGT
jgi:hypothetical protein